MLEKKNLWDVIMPKIELQTDLNTEKIALSGVQWTYDGDADDMIIDGHRLGIITYEYPIFNDPSGLKLMLLSLSILDEEQFPEFDIKQFGDIIMMLDGYDSSSSTALMDAALELVEASFPGQSPEFVQSMLFYE